MTAEEWQVLSLTLRAAALSTALILAPGLALGFLLARKRWRGKTLVETFIALPLVMPPVATGLILLKLLGRRGPIGSLFHDAGIEIVFTWAAVVIAMATMSAPFLVRAARAAFESVDPRLEQIARSLGATDTRVFFTISLPLASRAIAGGLVLAFARAIGEFGATVLVAGNIPGETATLAVTIYDHVQLGHDDAAMRLLLVAVIVAFAAIWISDYLTRERRR